MTLQPYIPLVLLVALVAVSAVMMVALSHLFSSSRPTAIKSLPYESGMTPLGTARERYDVKFYLVAVLFIVFDIEVVFMMPWAVAFRQLDLLGLGMAGGLLEMAVFVVILAVGFVYVWKRGALEWS
jgi:NADH-quinone oxidoreductase subunit A